MKYQSPAIGNEISCVMHQIKNRVLKNNKKLEGILISGLKKDNFNILGKISHEFNPHGYTITILLSESHAAFHTYPEYNSLFFYLYSCRGSDDGRKTYEFVKKKLKPFYEDFNERAIIVNNKFKSLNI